MAIEKVQIETSIKLDEGDAEKKLTNLFNNVMEKSVIGKLNRGALQFAEKLGFNKNIIDFSKQVSLLGKYFDDNLRRGANYVRSALFGFSKSLEGGKEGGGAEGGAGASGASKVADKVESSKNATLRLLPILMGIGGVVTAVLGSLKPIQTVISAIGTMFSMLFMPIALILLAFLSPVLMGLAAILSSKLFDKMLSYTSRLVGYMFSLAPTITGVIHWLLGGIGSVLGGIASGFMGFIRGMALGIRVISVVISAIEKSFLSVLRGIWDSIVTFVHITNIFLGAIKPIAQGIWNDIKTFIGLIRVIVGAIRDIANPTKAVSSVAMSGLSAVASVLHLSSGGIIEKTGLAYVHKGEAVVPSGASVGAGSSSPVINITVNANGYTGNPRNLADMIGRVVEERVGRAMRWKS